MSAIPIEIRGLVHEYGRRRALDGVDFELRAGEIAGLVGPNGSGKTTLLKHLAGFLRPTSGSVRVFGHEPFGERAPVMRRARFSFAPPALFETLTAREHVEHLGALGHERPERKRVDEALELVGLSERANERVRSFSTGMRQRLALAQALVPRPDLLVLDEPNDGLDPLAVLELRGILAELRAQGNTAILLSSHLLIEVDELVDHMLVLDEGRTVFRGTPRELCRSSARLELGTDDPAAAVEVFERHGIAAWIEDDHVETSPDAIALEEAHTLLADAGLTLESFHVERHDLEAALLARLREHRRNGGSA